MAGVADVRVPGYLGRVLDESNDPVGTCFQVAAGVLVTAWHVLAHIGATAESARVRIDPLASGEAFDAAVARVDQAHDLAVLVSEHHLSASAEELTATDQMAPRTAVTVTGHSVIADSGRIARSLTTIGQWTGPATWEDAPPAGRMTAEALMPGMSGAPVIRDSDASVAGVVSGRYNSADDWLKSTVWVARTEDLAMLLDGIAAVTLKQPPSTGPVIGRRLAEVTDPFVLEVHRPVQLEDAPLGLSVLPPYLPREHDQVLSQVVRAAADGRSGIAVLVGGSSTGKTRACWEALRLLRDQPGPWRLWHPIDPTRPAAALRDLPGIGPRTVVWLNEAQFYLEVAEDELGEQVAAGLRELLRDPGRAPVLMLATLWPQFWDTLTGRPTVGEKDRHAQARDLLAGHDITVPAAFTPAQMRQLAQTADARMVLAARSAPDGEVIQFLAGAPELLARYRNAPPAAAALIHAAMDARRLGMGAGLPQAFLEAAAPGYLADAEWDALGKDWLEQTLAYTAVPCKGARAPLTRTRPRPTRHAARSHGARPSSMADEAGPLYRLADYLDQHGRVHRADQIPPAAFWSAAAAHAAPDDQAALGYTAHDRGLYRDAARLHKNAAASGNPRAAFYLSRRAAWSPGADSRSAHWAAAHVALDDPFGVARLLDSLRGAGAGDQAAALLARDPAAHARLDDPGAVGHLLLSLQWMGAHDQTAALASRAAAHVPLDYPDRVALLLTSLRLAGAHQQSRRRLVSPRRAGAGDQAAALLARDPAAHARLDDPGAVASLLRSLRGAGAGDQAAALASRAAAHGSLDDPGRVIRLLEVLREAGAGDQAAALAARAAAHAPLDNPFGVARLLDSLQGMGAHQQAAGLLARDPAAHARLDDPGAVASLLRSLRNAGAGDQAAALASRAAAHGSLDDPGRVIRLLEVLREAGAGAQAAALAARAAAHAPLDNPDRVIRLLDSLRAAGAHDQAAALIGRLPAAGMFRLFLKQTGLTDQFRFGREADGTPAAPWGWEDLDLWLVSPAADRQSPDHVRRPSRRSPGRRYRNQVRQPP